ncbi:GNAT family N-acetyltransferase [Pseudomonas sp. RL]|uniref:GNAT family N-acetyltransferase n=1 Tax=Pseudomonas sp. RL TaxID=1452718 RepID=UPI0012DDCBE9|nr:GNAT family N-acetyltransferase [Pseudomonas sp. RL]
MNIKRLTYRLLRRVFSNRRLIFFLMGRRQHNSADQGERTSFTYIENISDLTLIGVQHDEIYRTVVEELKGGAHTLLFLDRGRIVNFSCLLFGGGYVGEIRRRIVLDKGSVYIYNCFTAEEYRGRGLYGSALRCLQTRFNNRPLYICCLNDNYASLKVIEKSGFERVAEAKYLSVLFFESLTVDGDLELIR